MSPHKWIIAAAITLLPCLPANAEATSPPAKTRVACIGNSITYGMTLPDSLRMPVGIIANAVGGAGTESFVDIETLQHHIPEILTDWQGNDYEIGRAHV